MRYFLVLAVSLLLSTPLLTQSAKNTFWYEPTQAMGGYAPLHLQYERLLRERLGVRISVGRFATKSISLPTGSAEWSSGLFNPLRSPLELPFWIADLVGKPKVGTLQADFNQRGNFVHVGVSLYSKPIARGVRWFGQPEIQWYSYTRDLYTYECSAVEVPGKEVYRTTTAVSPAQRRQYTTLSLGGGAEFTFWQRCSLQVSGSLDGASLIANPKAQKARRQLGLASALVYQPQYPVKGALVGPLSIRLGYRL